jgi:outer membrane protein assembly factor BamB
VNVYPGPGFIASPTVSGGAVFIGSQTGWFYKLDEQTGAVLSKVFLGYQPKLTCAGGGIAATATVTADPSDGQQTVYVAGVDGYLYALSAADLSQKWRSVIAIPSANANDYFQWSSPTVVNGKIYVGVASNCDQPLVPGALISYEQATGTQIAQFNTMPSGIVGGTIWSSAAVDRGGNVYVTTGNAENDVHVPYYSDSIIKLDPNTLTPQGSFTVPAAETVFDGDFGASPTIFGRYVGACDKNGVFYTLVRSTMKLAWSTRLGKAAAAGLEQCNAAAVYDGRYLYVSGPPTTIGGTTYAGSIRRLDPATGAPLWQTGLPNGVLGTPTMNGGGVIAVGTYDDTATPNAIYLISAATGRILRTLSQGSPDFAQNVFANGWLFTVDDSGVSAWAVQPSR